MGYSTKMASYLSGVTTNQLYRWAREGTLVPEENTNPREYSFRDIVALRSIALMRKEHSRQKIRRALDTMADQDLTDHLSSYGFLTDGTEIHVYLPKEESLVKLSDRTAQTAIYSFEEIYRPFNNFKGRTVPDLERPADGVRINAKRLRGTPTVGDSRVPVSLVVELSEDMSPDEIAECYPTIDCADVPSALAFDEAVKAI